MRNCKFRLAIGWIYNVYEIADSA